jgi:hypothetical protein
VTWAPLSLYVIRRDDVSLTGENLTAMVQQADTHQPPGGH